MKAAYGPPQAAAPGSCDPRWPGWREKWTPRVLWFLFLYLGLCLIALDHLPNTLWDPRIRQVTSLIGALGIWRYSWWLTICASPGDSSTRRASRLSRRSNSRSSR